MFLVCAGLSGVLKLDERTLLKLLQPLPNAGVSPDRAVETVDCASRTVEDGGLESFWSVR